MICIKVEQCGIELRVALKLFIVAENMDICS